MITIEDIKKYRKSNSISQQEMANRLSITRELLNKIENGSMSISKATNLAFKELIRSEQYSQNDSPKTIRKPKIEDSSIPSEPINVYDVGSRAGIVTVYDENNNGGKPIGTLPKEMFPGCNHAEIIRGDSMHPIVRNGALVVGKIFEKSLIINGDMYLVHTTNGLHVVKYVHNAKKGTVKLLSYNEKIPPQEITIDEIKLICRVLFIINPA